MKTVKKEIEKIRNEMNQDQYYLHCQYIMGILAVKIKIIGEQLVLRNKRDVIQNVSQRIKLRKVFMQKCSVKIWNRSFPWQKRN